MKNFWNGQKEIILLDPNILACENWRELFQQLIDSKSKIDFTQGLDIRFMTDEKAEMINKMKIKKLHFALDNANDEISIQKLTYYREKLNFSQRKLGVYVLTNFNTTLDEDVERIKLLDKLGYEPYVMIFNKHKLKRGHILKKIQRIINNRYIYYSIDIKNYNFFKLGQGDEN